MVAFNVIFNNFKKPDDYTIVSHVYSDKKNYLDMKFKPENVKQDYEAELIGTHTSKWTIV